MFARSAGTHWGHNSRQCAASVLCAVVVIAGCSGEIGEVGPASLPNAPAVPGAGAAAGAPALGPGSAQLPSGAAGAAPSGMAGASAACKLSAARAPLRRLTPFEYDNSARDLLGDDSSPARAFPSEELGNGFGNDADAQAVSSLLAEQYGTVAEGIAQRATETPAALAKLDACAASLTAATEPACARTIVDKLGSGAFRRQLQPDEGDALYALFTAARAEATFAASIATVIEAVLQAPDFLYRIELGVADAAQPGRRRVSGDEMATRLSYLFWGTLPDDALRLAAERGELATAAGVLAHARRMLEDERSRPVVRFFFDNLLPIASLTGLERDRMLYPNWSAEIGALMHEETQTFLEHEIFEGSGTWPGILTAPYTFANDALAKFYGMPSVTGAAFQKVSLDPTQRLGLLTQGALMAGTTASNHTNPVIRGAFVARELMCRPLALPSDPQLLAMIKPPDPYSAKTARERYAAHRTQAVCASCHQQMDPIGLTFENFDPVGRYRTTENDVSIDASGELPGSVGATVPVRNAVELVQALAAQEETQACFAKRWLEYAYGRSLRTADSSDACLKEQIQAAFKASGYNVKQLLLDLTQTEAFLYLPEL